jgi:hypothetical protein
LCFDDLEKGLVGEGFLGRVLVLVLVLVPVLVDFVDGRLSRSLSREREEVEAFFSGDVGGVGRGEADREGVFLSLASSGGFFADADFLNKFICESGSPRKELERQGRGSSLSQRTKNKEPGRCENQQLLSGVFL